jgi:hypothetical protein
MAKKARANQAREDDSVAETEVVDTVNQGADVSGDAGVAPKKSKEKPVKYRVLDPGAVLTFRDGEDKEGKPIYTRIAFPRDDAKKGEEMEIALTHSEARRFTDAGIRMQTVNPDEAIDKPATELAQAESG